MKVALISFYSRQIEYPNRYSLSVLRLAEYLKSYEINVDIIPIDLKEYENFDVYNVINNNYDLVGISNFSWVNHATIDIDKKLKEINPNLEIVIGGPEVEVMDINQFDKEYFIIGEGEEALKRLCDYIKDGKKDKNFFNNNINIFNKENVYHEKVEDAIQIKNPLFTNTYIDDRDFLWYETCRGCAYNCGYCGHKTRHKVAYIPLDIVEQEIKNIGRLGFKQIFVIDPNFAGSKKRAKVVLSYFNKYAPNTKIGLYFRPEFIDSEMIELLKNANISQIRIGIQTTNINVPQWLRSNNMYSVINELPKLSENNIPWRAELITGLPGDDFEGLKNSIDFVCSLNPTEFYSYHLTIIPNTPLYNLKDNFSNNLWITTDEANRAYECSSYSHEELLEMLEYAKEKEEEYNLKEIKIKKIRR